MLAPPQIVQAEAQPAAVIRFTIPRAEIQQAMGSGMKELMGTVAAQGIAPTGPLYSYHRRMDPEVFDFEIGVPVATPVAAAGRVQPGLRPAATVARTVYQGGFEGLGAAWGEFQEWILAQGQTPGPDLWESYLAGPESSPDPRQWRTELNRPLIRES